MDNCRTHLPVTQSPDIDFKHNSFHATVSTPPKLAPGHPSPTKLSSTPRKRLILGEMSTPKKLKITSPVKGTTPTKRPRSKTILKADFKGPMEPGFKGLSPAQLAEVIKNIKQRNPEIEKEIHKEMPKPDLALLEEQLDFLKSNYFNRLPTSRLTSKTDSPALRVATHLGALKKCVIATLVVFVSAQVIHWYYKLL